MSTSAAHHRSLPIKHQEKISTPRSVQSRSMFPDSPETRSAPDMTFYEAAVRQYQVCVSSHMGQTFQYPGKYFCRCEAWLFFTLMSWAFTSSKSLSRMRWLFCVCDVQSLHFRFHRRKSKVWKSEFTQNSAHKNTLFWSKRCKPSVT